MQELELAFRLSNLNARYARSIDAGRLEEWPHYFTEDCSYRVTTHDNHVHGLHGALIYAKGKGMLTDRVQALCSANIYEAQAYRHVIDTPLIDVGKDGAVQAETPFVIVRTMRTGQVSIFATGVYLDRVTADASGQLLLAERLVVCDSTRIDTLLAIPL